MKNWIYRIPLAAGLFILAILLNYSKQADHFNQKISFPANGNKDPLLVEYDDTFDNESVSTFKDTPATPSSGLTATLDAILYFDQWMDQTLISGSSLTSEDTSKGIQLAKARRPLIKSLIQNSPERALEEGLRLSEYLLLPPEVQAYTQEPFTEIADWMVMPVCNPEAKDAHDPIVEIVSHNGKESKIYQVKPFGKRHNIASESNAPLIER